MTIRVGIIGTGAHRRRTTRRKLAHAISGSTVSRGDRHRPAREPRRSRLPSAGPGCSTTGSSSSRPTTSMPCSIASIGETHAAFTLACIAAGKPVLCEKPLAPTTPECEQVLDAEVALGRRLVIVGFMRRYDPGYRQVKASLDSGAIGEALMLHNVHRNPTVPESFTSFMTMTDSMIHEVDITPLAARRGDRRPSRSSRRSARRRRSRTSRTRSSRCSRPSPGSSSTAEFFANCQYGYDVRCELVGSEGTASLVQPGRGRPGHAPGSDASPVPPSWRVRFGAAYARRAPGVDQRPRARRDRRARAPGTATRRRGSPSSAWRPSGTGQRIAHRLRREARLCTAEGAAPSTRTCSGRRRCTELPGLVADLGYEYIELSPREDFIPFFTAPAGRRARPSRAFRQALSRARASRCRSLLPLFRWSGPDEDERAGGRAVLEAVDRDRRRARRHRHELRVQRPARAGEPAPRRCSGGRWTSCCRSSSGRASSSASSPIPTTSSRTAWSPPTWCGASTRRRVTYLYCAPHTFHMGGDVAGILRARRRPGDPRPRGGLVRPPASSGLRYILNPPGTTGPDPPAPRHRAGRGRLGRVLRDPRRACASTAS